MSARHSVNMCLADCICHLYRQFGELNLGTFLKYRNFLRLIFFIFICIIRTLNALKRLLYNLSIIFIGFRPIVWSFLSVFLLCQAFFSSPKVFCTNTNLIVAFIFLSTSFSLVYLESDFFYFLFLFFTCFHPIASLTATSASLFLLISVWVSI